MYRYFYINCEGSIMESGVLRTFLIPLEELNNYANQSTQLYLIFCKTVLRELKCGKL
jgi:hypothetical protein